ncbi:hypothetical protein A2533_03500 [Candidatus Falkowbacteria bacterium RIFOXYD2_FULL_35_9]|uniref:Uncharacterized protein n=1 Tax=Candidatus Falkowbacteria bacterium RIFOXYC2_FULL_36_12 TaxID=1798002 RepID=A0A1F5T0E3_9BACT|nr:MAG: hypothetical protein A2478_03815 [Candidatus Falkowbacteria bacterium RIFOXYC2_FULL_36_12]OGF33867.1 MAG: hypothetical protein A2223_03050 [Candidatus Falkowbacteria bacterium RIFOXYA2_FULL_35_8]OGF47373.1 MAG: hypothetical protein A2533_03500 [Candidatus Falkowbacteria bacterium RIFOXYD2_FULL_35_9]
MIITHKIKPLIKVQSPNLNFFQLQELIEEFLHEHSQPTFYQGKIVPAVHLTPDEKNLNQDLQNYLNRHNNQNLNFQTLIGYFHSPEIEHSWLQSSAVLIDLALPKFAHFPVLPTEIRDFLSDYSYLISDKIDDSLYRLYIEEVL